MDTWQRLDEQTCYQRLELCHFGIEQRWLVVGLMKKHFIQPPETDPVFVPL